jgi:hypothetical protein
MTTRWNDRKWLAMMLERLRQHAFNAGVCHMAGDMGGEDREATAAAEARDEILTEICGDGRKA